MSEPTEGQTDIFGGVVPPDWPPRRRRHSAIVLRDALFKATDRWGDQFTMTELDAIAVACRALSRIACGWSVDRAVDDK